MPTCIKYMNASSDLRHSFTTRLLFTVIPATWYASKDASIQGLTQVLANDLMDLFHTGIPVDMPDVPRLNLYIIPNFLLLLNLDEFPAQKGGHKVIGVLRSESHHAAKGKQSVFRAAFLGVKGDWPWLRKCMFLRTGFTSLRICHLCPGEVSCKSYVPFCQLAYVYNIL